MCVCVCVGGGGGEGGFGGKLSAGQNIVESSIIHANKRAQWLIGRVLDSRPRGRRFESHRRHCVVSLSKTH